MGRVSLFLRKSDGTPETLHIYSHQIVLNLSGQQIESIDLSGLSSNQRIREIDLSENDLEEINLGSLRYCSSLEKLYLSGNRLKTINLAPLKSVSALRILRLNRNQLRKIDLKPLQNCQNLREIILSSNKIRQIDLAPLIDHGELRLLDLGNNLLAEIQLDPLLTCYSLKDVSLGENRFDSIDVSRFLIHEQDTQFTGVALRALELIDDKIFEERNIRYDVRWNRGDLRNQSLHQDFRTAIRKFAIFYSEPSESFNPGQYYEDDRILHVSALILLSYGLDYFIGYEGNIVEYVNNLPRDLTSEEIRRKLQLYLLEEVSKQIDNKGITVLFDIKKMVKDCGDCVFLAEKIIQRRKEEVEELVLYQDDEKINTRPLYFTAYGHQLLNQFHNGLQTPMELEEFRVIEDALSKIGLSIKITTDPSEARFLVNISNQMASSLKSLIRLKDSS
ncbi:MAG: leucine-rich repeat protein [Candidatus Lokiarchaeota archaeon]|nr:leucine-rich repeat protein [Candidatus Lokiarchaeota archaeon]